MELPEDVVRVVVSFLPMSQMEVEHRFEKLREVVKRLTRYSPEWLLRIGIKAMKTIRLHPEFHELGKRLLLEKVEKDVTLQEKIMRVIHGGMVERIEKRMRQLQAMYVRGYRGQEKFSVLWDRRTTGYAARTITRQEFDAHYAAMIANQGTNQFEDWGYKVSGCLNVSDTDHSFGLTI
jgi:hypothetical protein